MRLEDGDHAPRIDGFVVKISNPNYLQAELLWRQLNAAGVTHVVISPGSRSTPLARTVALFEKITCHVLIDERTAGFFALGLAKGLKAPVALLCTSGTAAAHYYPAVIEAAQSGLPLIVVTADRPQRLRNQGAPQTIDQPGMFGKYAKMTLDFADPKANVESMREMLYWLNHSLHAMNSAPLGPIHLNVPMDEPLVPTDVDAEPCQQIFDQLASTISWEVKSNSPQVSVDDKISSAMEASWCGLLVCGPDAARNEEERRAIHALSRKLGWPMLADVYSGLRFDGEPNMPGYDIFLRHEELGRLAPDFIFEFGGYPTSKVLNNYLNRHKPQIIRVQRDTLPRDPDDRARKTIVTDVAEFCKNVITHAKVSRDSLLLDPFWKATGVLRSHHAGACTNDAAELSYVNAALESLPDNSNLVLASSMPIRYADMLAVPMGKQIQVYAQRGTNGIDGVVSHAAGIASATNRPTLLICGDLAFLHDLGGWMAAREIGNLRVLLLNNNGGGIFNFLPISEYTDTFERLHGTPLDIDLSAAAKLFDIQWRSCSTHAEVSTQLNWSATSTVAIEVKTDRVANRTAHEAIVNQLLHALDQC